MFQVTCTFILFKAEIKPSYPPVRNNNRFCTIRHLSNSSRCQGSYVPTANLGPTLGGCLKYLLSSESSYLPHTSSIIQAVVHTLSADQQDIDPSRPVFMSCYCCLLPEVQTVDV